MRKAVTFVCLLVAVLFAGKAFAQRTTGVIIGTVSDDTGAVLPGVTVEVTGVNIVGTQSTVSNENGLYRFAALPPGLYDVAFKMPGFGTLRRSGIKVSVGGTVEENVSLKLSQLAEEVTVIGETPVVDTQGTNLSTNYDKDWVRNAPMRRFTFFDLINAAPGVNQNTSTSSRSSSFGSASDENSYQLDGTDFTAPFTGAAWPWPNTDAIEEIEVLSLGAPAEYGNMMGAVFNVVTRQGTNEWHGDANVYFQHQDLTDRNTSDEQDGGLPYDRDTFRDATVQLSGPIVKDKLWAFGSYQYQRDADSQPGTDPNFPARSEADRYFFKLNWQIDSKNKLMFAIHDDYYEIPERATATNAPSTITVETGHNPSPNVTFTSVLSDKTYVEARYSGFYGKDHGHPLNGGPDVSPRFYNLDTGAITGGIYYFYDGISEKTAFNAKLSHFADNFMGGSHDFKFGVQYNSGGHEYVRGYNAYIYTYEYYGQTYAYGYDTWIFEYGGRMRSIGVFADDSFRVNDRLTIHGGIRYDWSKAFIPDFRLFDGDGNDTGQIAPGIDPLYTWNTVSPRIGFNLKLTEDGRTVLKGHYGRYYRGVVTGELGTIGNSVPPRFFGNFDVGTNSFIDRDVAFDNTNLSVDPNYDPPYTDQFIVGFQRELANNLGLSISYVHKRGRNYPAWQDVGGVYAETGFVDAEGVDSTGRTIPVFALLNDPSERLFEITNPEGMETEINSVTAQLNKRMADNWQVTAAYTYLSAEGRLASNSRRSSLTTSQFGALFNDFGQNPNDFVNTRGKLIGDRPHTFKVQFVYELPAGFLLGANYTYQSGRPYARQARVSGLGIPTTILAEPIDGERRAANWSVLDLRAQKEFQLGPKASFALFADGLNVFNDDANESVASVLGTASSFGQPTRFVLPRRLMVGAKIRF